LEISVRFGLGQAVRGPRQIVGDHFPVVGAEGVAAHGAGRGGEVHPATSTATTRTTTAAQGRTRPIGQALRNTASACSRSGGYLLVISTQCPRVGCENPRVHACNHCRSRPRRAARRGSAP